jgi:hypothetical protein
MAYGMKILNIQRPGKAGCFFDDIGPYTEKPEARGKTLAVYVVLVSQFWKREQLSKKIQKKRLTVRCVSKGKPWTRFFMLNWFAPQWLRPFEKKSLTGLTLAIFASMT